MPISQNFIYHISPGYRKATIWTCNQNRQRMSVLTVEPNPKATKRQKYEAIIDRLKVLEIPAPEFK